MPSKEDATVGHFLSLLTMAWTNANSKMSNYRSLHLTGQTQLAVPCRLLAAFKVVSGSGTKILPLACCVGHHHPCTCPVAFLVYILGSAITILPRFW